MRLILTLATSLLMTTSAQAEMPEVCQTHFNQETFDNGRSSGEVISLFHAIQGELNPMVNQDKVQPDKVQPALYFFALFFNEQVASAIRLHRAYLTAQKNLNAGNMLAGYDDSFNMWAAEMRVGLMGPHVNILVESTGFDELLALRISSLTTCYDRVIIESSDSYKLVYEQLPE
jgi:hypothetical protein